MAGSFGFGQIHGSQFHLARSIFFKLLAQYEEGAKLVRICQEKLAEAELKIQQLEKNAAGEMKLKPIAIDE